MTKKVVLRLEGNWADEFDYTATEICTLESWERHEEVLKKHADDIGEIEKYFGTNQYITMTVSEFLAGVEVIEIPEKTDMAFLQNLCHGLVGIMDFFDGALDAIQEQAARAQLEALPEETKEAYMALCDTYRQFPNIITLRAAFAKKQGKGWFFGLPKELQDEFETDPEVQEINAERTAAFEAINAMWESFNIDFYTALLL